MDADYGVDLDEIRRVVDEAEVFVVRFEGFDRRLLVDARSADGDPPMIRIVPRVSSAAERYRNLQELRPNMSLPEQITVFSWRRKPQTMRDAGIWERIESRLVSLGGPDLGRECDAVYNEFIVAERAEIAAAIRGGEGFETLWERNPSS
jgi:hypothetical protein